MIEIEWILAGRTFRASYFRGIPTCCTKLHPVSDFQKLDLVYLTSNTIIFLMTVLHVEPFSTGLSDRSVDIT